MELETAKLLIRDNGNALDRGNCGLVGHRAAHRLGPGSGHC
jgi:hypothetical protein